MSSYKERELNHRTKENSRKRWSCFVKKKERKRNWDEGEEIKDMCLENIPELPKLLIIQLFMGFWLGGKFFNIFMALSYKFFITAAEQRS